MSDFISLVPLAQLSPTLLLAMLAVIAAYVVFALVGFGSALMAGAPLALVMPVARVIPLLALLDFAGASLRGWRARRDLAWPELGQLIPGMLLGQLLGVLALARLPIASTAVALGSFVAIQGARGLSAPGGRVQTVFRHAMACGVFGGILGGLFGSGGFVYAAYLERRLANRSSFRASQAVLIALSTAWRIVLCAGLGLLDAGMLATTLAFVPAMLLGIYMGRRIDVRISRVQLFRLLNGLLIVSGVSLVIRFAG